MSVFWVKSTKILNELAQNVFMTYSKKIIFNFVIFVATKTLGRQLFSPSGMDKSQSPYFLTNNVPLFKKLRDNHFKSHFKGHFEGAKTFLTP
jgi:hypothetical protein